METDWDVDAEHFFVALLILGYIFAKKFLKHGA